ncbi:cytochrome P450 [Actinospica durhamensis]|uniref:Cytochrome P450 n=1 Tax=Actinospica durhamensis TaxID=1508375 RepID=A0A941IR44_9ACTN|nr:cytochrome P450 [Actinospica durhamensis]MBR7834897.1 cytochrome P450 [Actinospica durhamensis]
MLTTAAGPGAADLGDPHLYQSADRYRMWEELRGENRAIWTPPGTSPGGFWSVFSHQACSELLAPSSPFTSEYGMMIGFDRGRPDKAGGTMLVASEGERHNQLRRRIAPFLSRTSATSLSAFMGLEVRDILERLRDGESAPPGAGTPDGSSATGPDIASQVGSRLPAAVVCELLGIPASDRELVVDLTNHAFGGEEPAFADMDPSEAHTEILSYFMDAITRRRAEPGEDLVTALLADGYLDDGEILINCDNVLIGGNETTRHAVTGCFHALAQNPDILPALRADPALIPAAVEEILRWTSPAMHVLRVSTRPTVIAGQDVDEGVPVVAWLPAANRDPTVFPNPDELRLDRHPNRHLAFGNGLHHCLGAALARAELAVLLEALAETLDGVDLAEAPQWMSVNQVQGYRSLPVTLHWR